MPAPQQTHTTTSAAATSGRSSMSLGNHSTSRQTNPAPVSHHEPVSSGSTRAQAPSGQSAKPASTSSRSSDYRSTAAPQPSSVTAGSDRRVSFAQQQQAAASTSIAAPVPTSVPDESETPLPKTESFDDDESYGLNSDDDAFYAALDLGEDFGPPIHIERNVEVSNSYEDDGPSVLGGYQAPTKKAPEPSRPSYSTNNPAQRAGQALQQQHEPQRNAAKQDTVSSGNQGGASASHPRPTSSQMGGFHFPPGVVSRNTACNFVLFIYVCYRIRLSSQGPLRARNGMRMRCGEFSFSLQSQLISNYGTEIPQPEGRRKAWVFLIHSPVASTLGGVSHWRPWTSVKVGT